MTRKIIDWIKSKLQGPLPPVPVPVVMDGPERERQETLETINAVPAGYIRCPFCLTSGAYSSNMLYYDKRTNYMKCGTCFRSGSMKTLRTRLADPDAYRKAVD
jgi:hypothetical protein